MILGKEDILLEDLSAVSAAQLSVSMDMTSQDVFQVAKSGNLDNICFERTAPCETYSDLSVKDSTSINNIEEVSMFTDNIESATLDWLNENMNFENDNNLNQSLEFPESLDSNCAQSSDFFFDQMQTTMPCLPTDLQLDTDLNLISPLYEECNATDLACSTDETVSASHQIETEQLVEVASLEASSLSDETQLVPNSGKISSDDACKKYLEMRRKNNIASQRSRRTRKIKDLEMTEKLKTLKAENKKLSLIAQNLEKKRDALQKYLLQVVTQKQKNS